MQNPCAQGPRSKIKGTRGLVMSSSAIRRCRFSRWPTVPDACTVHRSLVSSRDITALRLPSVLRAYAPTSENAIVRPESNAARTHARTHARTRAHTPTPFLTPESRLVIISSRAIAVGKASQRLKATAISLGQEGAEVRGNPSVGVRKVRTDGCCCCCCCCSCQLAISYRPPAVCGHLWDLCRVEHFTHRSGAMHTCFLQGRAAT